MSKDDEFRYEGKLRSAPYDPMLGDETKFILCMDSKKYSPEEQDQWGNWIAMCMAIKKEHDENIEEVAQLREEIFVSVVRGGRAMNFGQKGQQIIRDAIHWATCLTIFARRLFDRLGIDMFPAEKMEKASSNAVFINREYSDKKDG